jgi:hypothetical protein
MGPPCKKPAFLQAVLTCSHGACARTGLAAIKLIAAQKILNQRRHAGLIGCLPASLNPRSIRRFHLVKIARGQLFQIRPVE